MQESIEKEPKTLAISPNDDTPVGVKVSAIVTAENELTITYENALVAKADWIGVYLPENPLNGPYTWYRATSFKLISGTWTKAVAVKGLEKGTQVAYVMYDELDGKDKQIAVTEELPNLQIGTTVTGISTCRDF